ncbi:hypothetical protein JDV02_008811 [Purpureocillium takamizusanense]|uniref:Uncharacterized protein n=1 Tax=Purpureocillium takamizusanense TaxID=2060973 RepID=A0A9Q8VFJ3_9HYPO|nr:uncharacterized protein JDV02_008811 [Purpureocillium takamizusanense]UNI22969.1 hypothetical protein JDV02_008811 [Purpureocillium takamizusanense]
MHPRRRSRRKMRGADDANLPPCAGEYHAVNQIVGKGLHQTDDDSFNFTRTLLERLETTKAERADDDAIVDNDAGQAYVEQFAQETFARAERALRADRVTRQTADTFDAAATFFDLTREWADPPDAETLAKIKFAKWNAARILKAIREGRDPNESNPKQPEAAGGAAAGGEDDMDAELRRLAAQDPEARELISPQPPRAATVEDVPDDEPAAVPTSLPDEPPMPPPQVQDEGYFPAPPPPPPVVPSHPSAPAEPFVPSPMSASPSPATQIPPQPSPQIPTKLPSRFAPPPPAPQEPSAPPPAWSAPPPVAPTAPAPAPVPATTMHHKDLNQAQKHAKWAISALNFEDVPTAVQELRNALAMLGAQ